MKIGILTFWNTPDNYGQMLQCYALQSFLRALGHDTFLVRTGKEWQQLSGFVPQLRNKIRSASRLYHYPLYFIGKVLTQLVYILTHGKWKQYQIDREFDSFRRDYLHCSDTVYSLEELKHNPPEADCFIVGSDQIWNTRDGVYFLSWANDKVKKLAYAASFGGLKEDQEFCDLIRPWIKRFDWISVREQSGIEICRRSGREDAELVCDPTLLIGKEVYSKLAVEPKQKPVKKYIFVYLLGTRTRINMKEIYSYAKKSKLDVMYVGSQGVVDKFQRINPTVHEWLWYVEHSEMIFTNSFHGTVFSLIFQKPFMTFPVIGAAVRMNNRIETILDHYNLKNRFFKNDYNSINLPINFFSVKRKIQKDRNKVNMILSNILK